MGFLARAIERKAADPLAIWAEMLRAGRSSKAGPTINLDNALRVAAFLACLRVLSQGCAQVPFKLFREVQVDGLKKIEPARSHPVYDLVGTMPNEWQTSYEFREQLVIHAALGDAYAWKNVLPGGRLAELILLDPGRMMPEQPDEFGAPRYKYTLKDGKVLMFARETIWHVRGPSWTGFAGLQMLSIAREALGLSIATEEAHASLHANGVRPSGVYSVDGNLSDEQHKKLAGWLKKEAETPGSTLILDRGAKWMAQVMTGVDAQHLETRKHQIEEVCRFMGVSPLMVFYSDKATTYASAEQMFLAHVVHTLAPWYTRIEQSADVNLLSKRDRDQGHYFKFMAAGLMRGAAKDRAEFYAKALGSGGSQGWMTPDEVRALEEQNPMGGEAAKLPAPSSKRPEPAKEETP